MAVVWIIVAVVAAILEIVAAGTFFFLGFAVGAVSAAVVAALGLSVVWQCGVFVVVSVVSALGMVKFFKSRESRSSVSFVGSSRFVGREVFVLDDFDNRTAGTVEVDGERFKALTTGARVYRDDAVRIVKVDGIKLVVEPADSAQ